VYGGYDVINENGVLLKKFSHNLPSGRVTNKLFNKNYISIGCILIKHELLLTKKFDDRYDLMGDMDLWIRLSLVNNFYAIPKTLEYSRVHDSNTSKNLSHRWLFEKRMLYRKILLMDSYYIDEKQQIKINGFCNFDHPGAIDCKLLIQNISELKEGGSTLRLRYSFKDRWGLFFHVI
jgi:hypothetical protein